MLGYLFIHSIIIWADVMQLQFYNKQQIQEDKLRQIQVMLKRSNFTTKD